MSGVRVMDRRSTIAGVLASATVFALPQWASGGRVVVQRGMVGGGLVESGESEAHFSLFASRLIVAEGQREVVAGRVLWVDVSDGLTMTSTQVTEYRVLPVPPEQGQAREICGTMRVNGDGEDPFYSVVVDAGPPGPGWRRGPDRGGRRPDRRQRHTTRCPRIRLRGCRIDQQRRRPTD